MHQKPWQHVRRDLGHNPVIEGVLGEEMPIYVERYLYRTIERTVGAIGVTGLITQFGGGRVREGEQGQWRSQNLPTQSLLVPASVPTHWHYSGTVDYAVFYFVDGNHTALQSLNALAESRDAPMAFSDPLVGASARQLVNELQKGSFADEGFMVRLATVMLEQTFRVLTTPSTGGINPRHAHFSRLQVVLNYLHNNLTEDLSAESLASRAGVSLAHFRRIFQDAMGMPPHRYIMSVRLEQARKLLAEPSVPISRIAQECGFSSQSHLTASFRAAHGVTPADFRAAMMRRHERSR